MKKLTSTASSEMSRNAMIAYLNHMAWCNGTYNEMWGIIEEGAVYERRGKVNRDKEEPITNI